MTISACLGFLYGIRERFRSSAVTGTFNGLYVGQIHSSFSRFSEDHCIELAIRVFNGTRETISLGQLRGAIRYGETINGQGVEKEMLPAPAVLTDRTNISTIAPFTEMTLILEQRIPRTIAARMNELFEAGHTVTFDLRSLEIPVSVAGRSDKSTTLPTHSLTFRKAEDIVTNRIVYAIGKDTLRVITNL
jgi:hypothetical protein